MSLLDLARAERVDLPALLESLSPTEWSQPSLCAGWSARDVVAHLLGYEELDRLTGPGAVRLLGRIGS